MEPVKLPVEEVVIVAGVVVMAEPSYFIVMAEFVAKLPPEMFTVVPLGPLVGFNDIDWPVTVNCAEAELVDASVALTVRTPTIEDDGTIMEPVKLPVEEVVIVAGVVVMAEPSNVIVIPE